jgi:co-chaperonin GroES (HSP10)
LKRNEKGAKSWLSIGQFDEKVHKQNFTIKTIEGFPQPVWTFEAYDVRIGDFIYTSEKHTTTVISNNYPYILLQSKDEMAGLYYIGNFSAHYIDVQFQNLTNVNNSVQAFFPQMDCADVAIKFSNMSLQFKSHANWLYTLD